MWGPVRLHAGLKVMLERPCRTLSCAPGAQKMPTGKGLAPVPRVFVNHAVHGGKQRHSCASRHRPCSHLGRYLYCECFLIKELFF